jgi:hypothetical protein
MQVGLKAEFELVVRDQFPFDQVVDFHHIAFPRN